MWVMNQYEYRIRPNELVNKMELKILNKIGKKKLVAYGTTSRWLDLNMIVYLKDMVEFFVDSDSNKWGTLFYGKEVKNPKVLRELDLGEYAIVVTSAAFEEISVVLDDMGMEKDIDYFNVYQYLHILEGRPFESFNKFMNFLDTVPEEIRVVVPDKKSPQIGIVMSVEGHSRDATDIPYQVSLFLILKWHGYNVKLIVDGLPWDGDIILYEGRSEVCEQITEMIVQRLRKMIPQDDILFINSADTDEISKEDEQECERIADYSAKWLKWQNIYNPQFNSVDFLRRELAKIYKRNLPCIDSFFKKNNFDTIDVPTALHVRTGVYKYIGEKRKIRVSSGDGIGETTKISANGPAYYQKDITCLLEGNWMNEEEEQEVIQRATLMWNKRKALTLSINNDTTEAEYIKMIRTKGYSNMGLQSKRAKEIKAYDVIIPLNVENDGASIGVRSVFENREQWLADTLDFVINKCGKTVLLREHPVGRMWCDREGSSELYIAHPEILAPYMDNPSLLYVTAKEDINLYQYIEQCRVVIPWTSTVGIESGLLKKNVLMHTDFFYKNSSFVLKADSSDDYFKVLQKCIVEDKYLIEDGKKAYEDALKYFYYAMSGQLVTNFTRFYTDYYLYAWKFTSFMDLLDAEGVEETIQIIAENVPSVYLIEKQHRRIYD